MDFCECKKLIRADYSRLPQKRLGYLIYLITNASFKVTFWFRVATWLKGKGVFYIIPYFLVAVLYKHYQYLTGIQLPIGSQVGGGISFPHYGSVVIHSNAVIGHNCTIYQGVTIGGIRGKGVPSIGDNVVIFSSSQVIGNVKLGNNVVVGAGSVVVKDAPNNCVIAGVPAKVISNKGEEVVSLYL